MNYNYIYSEGELELLKSHFADNEELLKLLRKVFLPRMSDSAADIGGMTSDVAMHPDLQVKNYPTLEQAMIGIEAHSKSLQHVEKCLWQIKMLAGQKNETVAETKKRLEKDSAK